MTSECLDSVFEQTKDVSFEVILVDNASTDGSKEFFSKDPRIRYVYNEKNMGFGKANNIGFRHSKGEYVFLLNSDTILRNNAVKTFVEKECEFDSRVCLGCVLLNKDLKPMHSYGSFPTIKNMFRYIWSYWFPKVVGNKNEPSASATYPLIVDYITGAALFIPRKIIDTFGFFDEDFFMYFEETELQYRYRQNDVKSVVILGPDIVHYHGASSVTKRKNMKGTMMNIQSRLIYAKKIFPYYGYLLVYFMHWLLIPRIIIGRSCWKEKFSTIKLILTAKRIF